MRFSCKAAIILPTLALVLALALPLFVSVGTEDTTVVAASSNGSIGCPNGKKEGAEQCDDGNRNNGDGCNKKCKKESGYVCAGSPSKCTKCGDGKRQTGEECDDGNAKAKDGCSKTCVVENGWRCNDAPSGKSVCKRWLAFTGRNLP